VAGLTRRSPHEQRLTLLDRRRPKPLPLGVQFVAHLDPSSIKFDRHNSLLVTLVVPPEFAELALDVRYLAGIPLSVDVQRWRVAEHPANASGNGAAGG
jgi:hypothetical protein